MPRTLRMQVLAIAILTIAAVLGVSDWLAARLAGEALRADLIDRVANAVSRIAEGRSDPRSLRRTARDIVLDNRDVAAVDVWVLSGDRWQHVTGDDTAPPPATRSEREPDQDWMEDAVPLADGTRGARMLRRVTLSDGEQALVRTDISLEAWSQLRAQLRWVDVALFVASVGLLALVMDRYFRRWVEPRIAQLGQVMARAAEGKFDEPIGRLGAVELDSLADGLNAMLARVDEATQGLEGRVARATEELRELQAQAARSERFAALGQTVATLAHELGTPLNSVLGYAQLLRQDATNPEQASRLDVIESQVRRMIETIRRMLDHTRQGVVEREPVEVSRLVDEVLTLVQPRAADREVALLTSVDERVGIVQVDPIAVRQVMVNLVNNALDAEGTTRIRLTVGTTRTAMRDDPELEIEVSDDGSGIPAEEQDNIFKPFYTTKAEGRGTGLGLAIVDHLVRAHAGQITVESTLGAGTAFRVRFPCGGNA